MGEESTMKSHHLHEEATMCHGYEWELLMARAREAERRKQKDSKPEAAKQPASTPATPASTPSRNQEPVPA
jgi:hypothetical protein